MLGLFGKKCWLCSEKIEKGKEITRKSKAFCSDEHADEYEKRIEKQPKGGCCG